MVISKGIFKGDELEGKTAIVTGGGSGIGYEASKSLAWLGCKVIIAEINLENGLRAEQEINILFKEERAIFHQTDMGEEHSIKNLINWTIENFGTVDIILNNATIAPIGSVKDVPIEEWDKSYRVNLRGPIILIKEILPFMIKNNKGVIVNVSSSGAAPYMGAYEIFKMAQMELSNTLVAELEGTEIVAFTIGPGLVRTNGALNAIEKIAPLYGKSIDEFFKMSEKQIISVEAAGAGFAAAIALANRYNGLEIGSIQALYDSGIDIKDGNSDDLNKNISLEEAKEIYEACKSTHDLLIEQNEGWKKRPMFERMWVYRDFTKHAGMPVEQWLDLLSKLESYYENQDTVGIASIRAPFDKLVKYIIHLQDLSKGYIKDKQELETSLTYLKNWEEKAKRLEEQMSNL